MAAVQLPPPLIPERRPREPDIIDVDSFDDNQFRASGFPFQRRRLGQGSTVTQAILVADSDDEGGGSSSSSSNARRHLRRPRPSRSMFSPPPPPQDTSVPPVPPLPSYLPMHRRPPPFPSVVRPIAQPFPFEVNIQQVNPTQPTLPAAPPSHHRPSMGLGGALIALNRQGAEGRSRRNPTTARARRFPDRPAATGGGGGSTFLSNLPGFMQSIVHRITNYPPQTASDDDDILAILAAQDAADQQDDEDEFMRRVMRGRFHYGPVFGGPQQRDDVDYRVGYTHPGKPAPGYTFDFSSSSLSPSPSTPSTSTSASSSSTETTLICAKCLDPLVMGGSDIDRKERKVWGLRCGHLLDGKCLEGLMRPTGEEGEDEKEGKGKQKVVEVEDNPIRSRLRPRISDPTSSSTSTTTLPTSRPRPRPRPRPRTKAIPEASYEWICPVPGCGRVHVSVKKSGVWGMDVERGAIGIFV